MIVATRKNSFTSVTAYVSGFQSTSTTMDIRPNHTIYINNLNEKIKKDGE